MKTHFTKLVKAGGKLREFNFRKLPNSADLFHVDVSDDRGNRIIFKANKDDGTWKIQEQGLPKWVYDAEPSLQDAIESSTKDY